MNTALSIPDRTSFSDIQKKYRQLRSAQKDVLRYGRDIENTHRRSRMERSFYAALPIYQIISEMDFPGDITVDSGDTYTLGRAEVLFIVAGCAISIPCTLGAFLWAIPLVLLAGFALYRSISRRTDYSTVLWIQDRARVTRNDQEKRHNICRLIELADDIKVAVSIAEHKNGNRYSGAIVCIFKSYRVDIPIDLSIAPGTAVDEALSAAQTFKNKLTDAISYQAELIEVLKQEPSATEKTAVIDKEFEYIVQV
jgi:hypothetical protein